MAKSGRNKPRTSGTKRTGGDTAGSIIGNLLLFAVPGVGLIRVAMTAKRAIQAIRAMKGAKKIANPTAAQIKNAKPPSALPKPKSGGTTQLTSKPKGDVISGTAKEVKPGTSVVPSGGRAVKNPGTGVQRVVKMKDKPKGMKNATRNDKRLTGPKPGKRGSALGPTAAAALIAGMTATMDGDKKPSASTRTSSMPTPKSKPSKPTKRVDLGTVKARKVTPQKDAPAKSSGPSTRGSNKRGATKVISAGSSTGFGPKGNIFPGSAAERAAYMKMYGGTGSAAAKAAAAGKQGDMKAGRAAVDAAKKKRLSKKKD
jgi:hypothetical protein